MFVLKSLSSDFESPKRLGIFWQEFSEEENLRLSLSPPVLKKYFPIESNHLLGKKVSDLGIKMEQLSEEGIKKMEKEELIFLSESMFTYLAKQEISPRKLRSWLKKRKLRNATSNQLFHLAKEKKFLDQQRFIDYWVEKARLQANKPWWRVRREIEFEVMLDQQSSEEREQAEQQISSHEEQYQDLEILLQNRSWVQAAKKLLKSEPEKRPFDPIKRKIAARGFSETVIRDWKRHLMESDHVE